MHPEEASMSQRERAFHQTIEHVWHEITTHPQYTIPMGVIAGASIWWLIFPWVTGADRDEIFDEEHWLEDVVGSLSSSALYFLKNWWRERHDMYEQTNHSGLEEGSRENHHTTVSVGGDGKENEDFELVISNQEAQLLHLKNQIQRVDEKIDQQTRGDHASTGNPGCSIS